MSHTTDKVIDEMNKGIKYKCGHTTSGTIIMNSTLCSTSAYLTWAETTGNERKECFDCFLKKQKCEHEYILKTSLKHGRTICQCVFCKSYYEVD